MFRSSDHRRPCFCFQATTSKTRIFPWVAGQLYLCTSLRQKQNFEAAKRSISVQPRQAECHYWQGLDIERVLAEVPSHASLWAPPSSWRRSGLRLFYTPSEASEEHGVLQQGTAARLGRSPRSLQVSWTRSPAQVDPNNGKWALKGEAGSRLPSSRSVLIGLLLSGPPPSLAEQSLPHMHIPIGSCASQEVTS